MRRRPVLALAAGLAFALGACRSVPPTPTAQRVAADSVLALPGVTAPVRVITDRWGIPHVDASNLEDLYFTWGFITARDRLWQMLATRQAADGALWRWLGNSRLRADGGAQLFELRAHAERAWRRLAADPAEAGPLARYAEGVNAWMDLCRSGRRAWPAEITALRAHPKPWRASDALLLTLAQGVLLDLDLPELDEMDQITAHGRGWIEQRRRFERQWIYDTIPDSAARRLWPRSSAVGMARPGPGASPPGADPALVEGAKDALASWRGSAALDPDSRASNVFAVGAGRSASGAPLLANDPHLPLGAPGPFHAIHLSVPDTLEAIGFAVPGTPILASGRNRTCAWGVTALGADVADLYADTLSSDDESVKVDGRWTRMRQASYRMRFHVLGVSLPPIGQMRRYTPHGPVVVYDTKHHLAFSVKWAALDDSLPPLRLVGVERSRTAAEVIERFSTLSSPALNVVAADRGGDVIYRAGGALPRRGFDPGYGPVPGDGAHEWQGLIPPGKMPEWHAPRSGYVVNCNNRPAGLAYPEALPRYDWVHDRALRIAARLGALPRVTLADMRAIQNDVTSRMAERFVAPLLAAIGPAATRISARESAALDTLRAWDDRAVRSDVAPTLLRGWWGALQRRSGLDGLQGLTLAALEGRAPEALARPGGGTESPAAAAQAALATALDSLTALLGPDLSRWTWDRAHQGVFKSTMGARPGAWQPAPQPEDGDNSTPSVGASRLPWTSVVTHGPAMRHLVDLAVEDSSLGVIPPGNSGDRTTRHFSDMLQRWADHEYVPMYLSWPKIEQAKESELRLTPGR